MGLATFMVRAAHGNSFMLVRFVLRDSFMVLMTYASFTLNETGVLVLASYEDNIRVV